MVRFWAYVVDGRASGAATPALAWYRFTPDRSGIHPQSELRSFTGLLQADGYAGYDKLYHGNRIQEVACWAHFRRKICECHQTSPTPLTTDLLDRIAGRYRIEEAVRGQPPDIRRRHRHEQAKPQIVALRGVIDDALRRLSPKSAMAKALAYGRKRWDALTRYIDEGIAEIDNNIAERAIRSIAIGRKNWVFAGSKAGGERAAGIYSVIETAKLNGVEPQPISPTSSRRSPQAGPPPAGTSSCRGTGQRKARPSAWRHDRSDRPDSHHARRHEARHLAPRRTSRHQ